MNSRLRFFRSFIATWLFVMLAASAAAQLPPRSRLSHQPEIPDYLPLAVGNSWTYAMTGFAAQGEVTVRVTDRLAANGRTYFLIEGYGPEPSWVRRTEDGRVVEYQPGSTTENPWYEFNVPAGGSWKAGLEVDCLGQATLVSRDTHAEVPAGTFGNVLVISYGSTICADAGWQEEAFAPDVGLLRRTMTTIGGPRSMVLTEARVGSRVVSAAKLVLSLSIDQPVYVANLMPPVDRARAVPVMHAELKIQNNSEQPLKLTMPSGQHFDFAIRDEKGRTVYLWSEGKFFTLALTTIELSPGAKTFSVEIPLTQDGEQPFPPGHYVLEAWLTTAEPQYYRASTGFEVRHVF